jgi:hypothetical protein
VHFKNGTADIAGCASKAVSNGIAVCKASFAASSPPHQLTATYLGSTVYNNSTSKARAVSVAKDTTTAVLTTPAKAVHTGKSVTYSVTVKPTDSGPTRPTGKVTFTDHGIAIKSCPGQLRPSGTAAIASCTVTYAAPGSHTVKGSYGGDPNFTGSAPKSALTVTVTWAPVAATTLTASDITATSAVVTGIVQPNGGNVYWQFWYGTGGSFTSASVLKGPRSGHTPVKVSATLTNLKPATTYSYRLVVIPPGAKSPVQGAVMKFTTKAA